MSVSWWWVAAGGSALAVAVAGVAWRAAHRRRRDDIAVAHSGRLTELPRYRRLLTRFRRRVAMLTVAVAIAVFASSMLAARPLRSAVAEPDHASRDIVLCLDVSGSMVEYNRSIIERVERLLDGFEGERVGLTIFNSSAVTVFPLTTDYAYVRTSFAEFAETFATRGIGSLAGSLEGDGTSLVPDGIASCALSFPDDPAADRPSDTPGAAVSDPSATGRRRSRSLIVATDNRVEGLPLVSMAEVAELLVERDIRAYAIYPLFSFESADRPETVEMRQLTALSGGALYAVDNAGATQSIIDRVERTEATILADQRQLVRSSDPGPWLAVAAVATAAALLLAWRARL